MEAENTSLCQRIKSSKILAVGIVWATLVLDFLLYSSIVPIIPKLIHEWGIEESNSSSFEGSIFSQNNFSNDSVNVNECNDGSSKSSEELDADNRFVGVFLAVKQGVQIIANVFVGPLIDEIGYDLPLFSGYIIIIASSMGFALRPNKLVLFISRGLQGVGSSFVSTAGMSLIADKFQDDDERGKMFGIALCGISLGLLAGPTYGAILFQFGGKEAPFIGMALMAVLFASLQLFLRLPKIRRKDKTKGKSSSHLKVVTDWQILMTALAVVLGNVGVGFLQGVLPLYMIRTWCAEEWMLGTVFLPADGGYFVAVIAYTWMTKCCGRMNLIVVSRFFAAAAFVAYPFCTEVWQVFTPGIVIGFPTAIINAAMYQATAYLVDTRLKESLYGGAYAISNTSFCLAYGAGPLIGGLLVPLIGFDGTMYLAVAVTTSALIPVFLLRKALNSDRAPLGEDAPLLTAKQESGNGTLNGPSIISTEEESNGEEQ